MHKHRHAVSCRLRPTYFLPITNHHPRTFYALRPIAHTLYMHYKITTPRTFCALKKLQPIAHVLFVHYKNYDPSTTYFLRSMTPPYFLHSMTPLTFCPLRPPLPTPLPPLPPTPLPITPPPYHLPYPRPLLFVQYDPPPPSPPYFLRSMTPLTFCPLCPPYQIPYRPHPPPLTFCTV